MRTMVSLPTVTCLHILNQAKAQAKNTVPACDTDGSPTNYTSGANGRVISYSAVSSNRVNDAEEDITFTSYMSPAKFLFRTFNKATDQLLSY